MNYINSKYLHGIPNVKSDGRFNRRLKNLINKKRNLTPNAILEVIITQKEKKNTSYAFLVSVFTNKGLYIYPSFFQLGFSMN